MAVKKKVATVDTGVQEKTSVERTQQEVKVNHKLVEKLKADENFSGCSKDKIGSLIKAVLTAIKQEVIENGSCNVNGFGNFSKVEVPETVRTIAFSNTKVTTPAYTKLKFLPTSSMTL